MRLLNALLFTLALTIFPSAFAFADEEQSNQQKIVQSVISMWDAVANNDLDAYLEHIHPNYSVFGEGDVYLHEGKDKEAIDYADYLGRASKVRTFMHQPKVTIRGDTAWITYHWNDAGYINGERFSSRGKSTRIFVQQDGVWLCIHSHFTAVP